MECKANCPSRTWSSTNISQQVKKKNSTFNKYLMYQIVLSTIVQEIGLSRKYKNGFSTS